MAEAHHPESFEQIVQWAYRTLPQTIRDLPDFPGIQVADEPPEDILKRKNWPQGTEMLGCYSGIHRTVRQHNQISLAPDLIFVFRGPIQRCSRGNLRAEVKEVVWHEVAHWLGHSEKEVQELGLSTLTLPSERNTATPQQLLADTVEILRRCDVPRTRQALEHWIVAERTGFRPRENLHVQLVRPPMGRRR